MAVARGSVSARHPEVPRLGLLRELRVLSGTAKWGEAARTWRGRGPGTPRKKGRRPQTYPAGSSRAGAPARRIMPLAARGW